MECSTCVALVIVLLVFLAFLRSRFLVVKLKKPPEGYHPEVTLPHTDDVEFYFADISPCSMKVRLCLMEAGVKFKSTVLKLPSVGSWDTKTKEFLCINPAGTVPVLLYKGNPIYESNEQLRFISENLTVRSRMLSSDIEAVDDEYWIKHLNWVDSEMEKDVEDALTKRPGNCLPILVMPCFVALSQRLSWKEILYGFVIQELNPKQIMLVIFASLGVHVFKFIPMLAKLIRTAKREMLGHLTELEELLRELGTKFLGGDEVVLADIAWAPVLDGLEFAQWWEHIDPSRFPHVIRYWENMKCLSSFKDATNVAGVDPSIMSDAKSHVKQWKHKYPWFNDIYSQ